MPNKFIRIDNGFLASVGTDSNRIPTLYYSKYTLVSKFFWMRLRLIYRLICELSNRRQKCLDFGGGGGVFLPTLCNIFEHVTCVDLEDEEAQQIISHYSLNNISSIRGDVSRVTMPDSPFDAIVAADVLEHFEDLSVAVDAIIPWLSDEGVFYTSLPTENWVYVLLRKVFHIEKPWDHYHTAQEVESYLRSRGFYKVKGIYVPLYLPLFPLFSISAWKRRENG